jgi:hypothetical protein
MKTAAKSKQARLKANQKKAQGSAELPRSAEPPHEEGARLAQ